MTAAIKSFGQWVRERRKQRNLTQKALGSLTGYAEITVRQIEHDSYNLTKFIVERFVNCLAMESDNYEAITSFVLKQFPASNDSVQNGASYRSGTPFIGRAAELAQIASLLRNPQCRCISIVGVGGVGKTRLASQALRTFAHEYTQETWFVNLTEITSTALMARAIADVLGITLTPFTSPSEQILQVLQTKQMLLTLDNFEQLVPEGIILLNELLENAPSIKFIVTTRERLQITAEWSIRLSGLDTNEHSLQSEAVNLFNITAQRLNNHFNPVDIESIEKICRVLQGIPLAIEMAASWTELYSCSEILNSLSTKVLNLTTRQRDVDERHKSLVAVFETTWERLTPLEQAVVKRLAVFRGGFTLDAAQSVAGGDLNTLARLQDKMLVQPQSKSRLVLHEMVRQLAFEKLSVNQSELLEAKMQHGDYFVKRLSHSEKRIKYGNAREEIIFIASEFENMVVAWETMLQQRKTDWYYLCWEGMWLFFNVSSRFHEGEDFFRVIRNAFDAPSSIAAENHIRDFCQILIASFLQRQGRIPESFDLLYAAEMNRIRSSLEPVDQFHYLGVESYVLHATGDAQAALSSAETALQVATKMLHDPYWLVTIQFQVGRVYHLLGNYEAAHQFLSKSLQGFRQFHLGWGTGLILTELGFVAEANGQIREALGYYEAVLAAVSEWEEIWNYHRTQISIGRVKLALGHTKESIDIFHSTLQALNTNPQFGLEIDCFVEISVVLKKFGDLPLAVALLEYCASHPECFQPIRNRARDYLTTIRKEMPDAYLSYSTPNFLPTNKSDVAAILINNLTRKITT